MEGSLLYKIATNKKISTCSDILNSVEGGSAETNDQLETEDETLKLHVTLPLTEEKVLKILQKHRTSTIKISKSIVMSIKRTLQQKCRRIFNRCCKLLFPIPKQSKRNNNNNNNSNNTTNNSDERNNNINERIIHFTNGTNNISEFDDISINNNNNATERNNNRSEDDHNSSNAEEYEKSDKIFYPFQQLLNELKGKIIIFNSIYFIFVIRKFS
jgi:hypothetical protein